MAVAANVIEERRTALAEGRNGASDASRSNAAGRPAPSIGFAEGMLMVAVAFTIDLLQILLNFLLIGFFINPVLSFVAWGIFFLWFQRKGMSYGSALKGIRGGPSEGLKNPMVINTLAFLVELVGFNLVFIERTLAVAAVLVLQRTKRGMMS